MELIGYLALIVLGFVLGTVGMGGSMLAIPILVYVFSLNMVTASAYALFITGTTSLAGFALKHKDDLADLRAAAVFGIPSLIASFATRRWIVTAIPPEIYLGDSIIIRKEDLLLRLLCVLMIVSAVLMLKRGRYSSNEGEERPQWLVPVGLFTGMMAGLVGAGGGFLILPSLVVFGRLKFPVAVGTTLLIISFNSLVGFCGDVLNYSIQWPFLLVVTGLCCTGLLLGYVARHRIASRIDQRVFAFVMLLISLWIVADQLRIAEG